MAYMLSAQLSATVLNVRFSFVNPSALIYGRARTRSMIAASRTLPRSTIAVDTFIAQNGLTVPADAMRTQQERLKNILDKRSTT